MNFLAYGLIAAVLLVIVTRGSFERLTSMRIQAWWAMALGFIIQLGLDFDLVPVERHDDLGLALLLVSYALLIACCVANLRQRGFGIALIGIGCNALVIALNAGMPVDMSSVGGCETTPAPSGCVATVKHQPAADGDLLPILSDFIPIPGDMLISYGDLILVAGIMNISYRGSRRRQLQGDAGAMPAADEPEFAEPMIAASAPAVEPAPEVTTGSERRMTRKRNRAERIEPDHWTVAPGTEDTWLAQVTGQYEVVPMEISSDDPWAALRSHTGSSEVVSVAGLVERTNHGLGGTEIVSEGVLPHHPATSVARIPIWSDPALSAIAEHAEDPEQFTAAMIDSPVEVVAQVAEQPGDLVTPAPENNVMIPVAFPVEDPTAPVPNIHASGETPSVAELMAQLEAKLNAAEAELAKNREQITSWNPAVAS